MAEQESQNSQLKKENAELKMKLDQMQGIDKEKSELEQRVTEIGSQMDKVRRKEQKLRYICEQFKSQLETSTLNSEKLKAQALQVD